MSRLYDCVVCLEPVSARSDGTIRVEGTVNQEEEWLWGPYPVHEPCRLDFCSPYDHQPGLIAYGFHARVEAPETVEMLAGWASATPGSMAHSYPGHWCRKTWPLLAPWPELTDLIDLDYNHLAGVIAARGSREATAGTAIAVHTAMAGKKALLFTGYPPQLVPPSLTIDSTHNPTPDHIERATRALQPVLVVVQRWERMHSDRPREGSRADELDVIGQDLKRVVSAGKVPTLVTTSVQEDIDLKQPRMHWTDPDSPASIMVEFCNPLLILKRHTAAEVQARVERHSSMPTNIVETVAWKA